MQAFAGWVALTGASPSYDRLKPWQDWLTRHRAPVKPVEIDQGWLLCWPASGNTGATTSERSHWGKFFTEEDAQPGHWCCEVGNEPHIATALLRTLLPTIGPAMAAPAVPGGFALCHWQPAQRTLTLTTDRLGCKPLFVVAQGDHVLFSTDLPLLLATPGLDRQLNQRAIVNRLVAADAGRPDDTLFQYVHRVPPGHLWQITPTHRTSRPLPEPPDQPECARDAAQALRERVIAAVHDSIANAQTPAVHLSGGLDSAAIAVIAARALKARGQSLLALCSVLPERPQPGNRETDEREYIAHVLAQESNIRPVWVTLPEDEHPFAALPAWFDTVGQAPWTASTHALARLGEAGRNQGVDVVLSGFGGDLFASAPGYRTITELCRRHRWTDAMGELVAAVVQNGWRATARAELAPWIRRWNGRHEAAHRPAQITETAWHTFLHEAAPHERPGAAIRRFDPMSGQQRMAAILSPGHLDHPVGEMCQFLSRAYGQLVCLPLLDSRVLRLVLDVDPSEFTRESLSRSLFRRAMTGILPEAIRLRSNKGPAFDPALMSHIAANRPALKSWADDPANPAWQLLNRQTFLSALEQVQPAERSRWRAETFQHVLTVGAMGRFLAWSEGRAH